MKQIFLGPSLILMIALSSATAYPGEGPRCTQDAMWEYVINNAYRVADEYAMTHNPRSTFASITKNYQFVKQVAGRFEGRYLLLITNRQGSDISFAVLLPLFDVNKPSTGLDDNKPLWRVVSAKLNGRPY